MKRWTIIVVCLVLAGIVIGTGTMLRSGKPVQVAAAARGTIRQFIDERGKTRLPREYRITTPQSGWVEEVTLAEGTQVKKGRVVAQMSVGDLADTVAESRAAVERLEAAIQENDDIRVESNLALQAKQFVESMASTVDAAQAQVDSSLKRSPYAETNLGRVRNLLGSGARTEDDLDKANLAYWEGQLGYRQNQLVWESLKSIQAATALLPKMVADYTSHKTLTRAVLEKQKAEAEARLRRAETLRTRGAMRSPVDGVILKRYLQNAQEVAAGTPLLTIGDLSQLEIEADILSQDVVDVAERDAVEIYGPAVGTEAGAGLPGIVSKIYPAGFTKTSSLGVEQQRVRVIIEFSPKTRARVRELGVGVDYRVRVRIFTDRHENALIVPRSALFRAPTGDWQVFVIRNGRAELQTVQLGLVNDWQAEIQKGVAKDEPVILAPDSALQPNDRVAPVVQ